MLRHFFLVMITISRRVKRFCGWPIKLADDNNDNDDIDDDIDDEDDNKKDDWDEVADLIPFFMPRNQMCDHKVSITKVFLILSSFSDVSDEFLGKESWGCFSWFVRDEFRFLVDRLPPPPS